MRARRIERPVKPVDMPLRTALNYERNDAWPSISEKHRFWNGERIPTHLQNRAYPDPRKVLSGEEGLQLHATELSEWQAMRLQWLDEAARG